MTNVRPASRPASPRRCEAVCPAPRPPKLRLRGSQARLLASLRRRGHLDALGIAPEALEAVEQARLRREDVHDEVEVIEKHPLRSLVALDVRGLRAVRPERVHHAIGDRAYLPRILPRADDE